MSRLDSFIRRLQAQRSCIDYAAELIAEMVGPVLELGLGNGRTYDHLRERMPQRRIFVFERTLAAHPDCVPPDDQLILGDVRETLAAASRRLDTPAVLAHCDIGSGDKAASVELAKQISPLLQELLGPNAVVISDQAMTMTSAAPMALPEGVAPGRYHMYRLSPTALA